jgi:hypothetical protein
MIHLRIAVIVDRQRVTPEFIKPVNTMGQNGGYDFHKLSFLR